MKLGRKVDNNCSRLQIPNVPGPTFWRHVPFQLSPSCSPFFLRPLAGSFPSSEGLFQEWTNLLHFLLCRGPRADPFFRCFVDLAMKSLVMVKRRCCWLCDAVDYWMCTSFQLSVVEAPARLSRLFRVPLLLMFNCCVFCPDGFLLKVIRDNFRWTKAVKVVISWGR